MSTPCETNKKFLGDGMPWDPVFDKPNPDPVNGTANEDRGAIHGVITIAGSGRFSDSLFF